MAKTLKEQFEEALPELPEPDDSVSIHEGLEKVEEAYQKGRKALREVLIVKRLEGEEGEACRAAFDEVLDGFHLAMLAIREEWNISSIV